MAGVLYSTNLILIFDKLPGALAVKVSLIFACGPNIINRNILNTILFISFVSNWGFGVLGKSL